MTLFDKNIINHHIKRYLSYYRGYVEATKIYKDKIFLLSHEKLSIDHVNETSKIFKFLGFTDNPFNSLPEDSYRNIHGKEITDEYIYEYRTILPTEIQNKILLETKEAEIFFYHNTPDDFI